MSRGSRGGMPPFGARGGMGFPMELPHGLNPELLAQMLGGGAAGKAAMNFPVVEQREEDDGVDRSRWQVLYPAYLNKKYTTAKGRRVSQAIAVEDPTVQEMKMICDHFEVPAHIEIVRERNKQRQRRAADAAAPAVAAAALQGFCALVWHVRAVHTG